MSIGISTNGGAVADTGKSYTHVYIHFEFNTFLSNKLKI